MSFKSTYTYVNAYKILRRLIYNLFRSENNHLSHVIYVHMYWTLKTKMVHKVQWNVVHSISFMIFVQYIYASAKSYTKINNSAYTVTEI